MLFSETSHGIDDLILSISMTHIIISRLNAFLLGTLFIFCILVWSKLPDRIPIHFGADGTPDRWVATTVWSWFGIPLFVSLLTIFMAWLSGWIRRRPDLVNIPNKNRFLELPKERQDALLELLSASIHAIMIVVTLMIGGIQYSIYRTAIGAASGTGTLVPIVVIVGTVLLTGGTIGLAVWINGRVEKLHREYSGGVGKDVE